MSFEGSTASNANTSVLMSHISIDSNSICSYNGKELKLDVGISCSNKLLFELSSISLQNGFSYGLLAPNGCGKSTLADVLYARLIKGFPKDLSMALVRSDLNFDEKNPNLTVHDFLTESTKQRESDILNQISEVDLLLDKCDILSEAEINQLVDRSNRLYELLDSCDEQGREDAIRNVLHELGFTQSSNECRTTGTLSGGWRMKCQLARAAIISPDILIVDEPSFLDRNSTDWLCKFIARIACQGTIVVLITHQEHLLNQCNGILHITADKHLEQFNGSYEVFKMANSQNEVHCAAANDKYNRHANSWSRAIEDLNRKIVRREKNFQREKVKQKDVHLCHKHQRAGNSLASKMVRLRKEHEKAKKLKKKRHGVSKLKIVGEMLNTNGKPLVYCENVTFSYENSSTLFEGLDLSLQADDVVALVSPNGMGKSTLIKILVGELTPVNGKVVYPQPVRFVYFQQSAAQNLKQEYGNLNPVDYFSVFAGNIAENDVRKHLGDFDLKGKVVFTKIRDLSTGQRVRLALAKEFFLRPNPSLLILDEVSDNLDFGTVQSLIQTFKCFSGAIIAISHQKEDFISEFVTKHWKIQNKQVILDNSEYLE